MLSFSPQLAMFGLLYLAARAYGCSVVRFEICLAEVLISALLGWPGATLFRLEIQEGGPFPFGIPEILKPLLK